MKKILFSFVGLLFFVSTSIAQYNFYINDAKKITELKQLLIFVKNDVGKFQDSLWNLYIKIPDNPPVTNSIPSGGHGGIMSSGTQIGIAKPLITADFKKEVKIYYDLLNSSYSEIYREFKTGNINEKYYFHYLDKIIDEYEKSVFTKASGTSGTLMGELSFPQQQIIYGVTQFYIKRAKEELVKAHLQMLYDTLAKYPIIASLFTNSLHTFNTLNSDNSFEFAKYGALFKASFEQDIRNLPVNLQDEYKLKFILRDIFKLHGSDSLEISSLISGAINIGYGLYLKKQLPFILDQLSVKYLNSRSGQTYFSKTILLSNILINSISCPVQNDLKSLSYKFILPEDLLNLSGDEYETYLKIIVLRNCRKIEKIDPAIIEYLDLNKENFITTLVDICDVFSDMQGLISSKQILTVDNVYTLFGYFNNLIIRASDMLNIMSPGTKTEYGKISSKILRTLSYSSEINQGISTSDYNKIMHGSISLIALYTVDSTNNSNIKILLKYGSFAVNMMSASSPEQVSAALDNLVPRDLFRSKSEKNFTITLSGYPGLILGKEELLDKNNSRNGSWKWSAGIFLPIGFDFNIPIKKDNSSMGLMLQIVDLGAVANYCLQGSSSENFYPQIGFKQLFSPGVSLLIRPFKQSPITLSGNICYTPELRNVTANGITTADNALRIGVAIGIDVTTLPILFSKK